LARIDAPGDYGNSLLIACFGESVMLPIPVIPATFVTIS
jgi:hypothetical protein